MNINDQESLHNSVLGKQTTYTTTYDPSLLYALPRKQHVQSSNVSGVDRWICYELSWLNSNKVPQNIILELLIDSNSKFIVESKSFKLYLNSLNFKEFASVDSLFDTIITDLNTCIKTKPLLRKLNPSDFLLLHQQPSIINIDTNEFSDLSNDIVTEHLVTQTFRSLCPVTAQPDWATLHVIYEGPQINQRQLIDHITALRNHQDFHETCVELLFSEIQTLFKPTRLTLYATFLRRGGIEINPLRSNASFWPLHIRDIRQ